MRIARKIFQCPKEYWKEIEEEVTEGFWNPRTVKVKRSVLCEYTFQETLDQVKDFVDSIGPSRLINMSEYTVCRNRIGDDGCVRIVVWYWEEDNGVSSEGLLQPAASGEGSNDPSPDR